MILEIFFPTKEILKKKSILGLSRILSIQIIFTQRLFQRQVKTKNLFHKPIKVLVKNPLQILSGLANSSLVLRGVKLLHFPFGEPFREMLRNKGDKIEEMSFVGIGQVSGK